MRSWLRVSLTLPLLGGPLTAVANNWLDLAADCQYRLQTIEMGSDAEAWASEHCPELAAALAADSFDPPLANFWLDDWSLYDVEALASIAQAYERPGAARPLHRATLDDVLAQLPDEQRPETLSLWDRIGEWLRSKFGREAQAGSGLLERWLSQLKVPDSFWVWVGYISTGLIVIAAIAIVINELRQAGLLKRKQARPDDTPAGIAAGANSANEAELQLTKSSLLLERILSRLRGENPAPFRAALTHRELIHGANTLPEDQRPKLVRLIQSAERMVYGNWAPSSAELEPVILDGEQLLAELEQDGAS